MYNRTFWVDHVVDQSGGVIQQGTLQDQAHFNNMETGIADSDTAIRVLTEGYLQLRRAQEQNDKEIFAEILGESKEVELSNTKKYPFNSTVSSPVSVALTKNRKNLFYSIEATAVNVEGGLLGEIHITDKAVNGFKVSFDGSASRVTLSLRIKGGMA